MTDRERLRIIEEWTGHRSPSNLPMAFARGILIVLALALIAFAASSCTTTTTTAPDGTVTVTKAPAPGVLPFAGAAIRAYSPRPIIVREEKAATPADLRRILRGRPVTKQEIASRWKPAVWTNKGGPDQP